RQGGADNLFRRLTQARVNDFHSGITERARDDLRATIVAVQSGFGDDNADLLHLSFQLPASSFQLPASSFQLSASSLQLQASSVSFQLVAGGWRLMADGWRLAARSTASLRIPPKRPGARRTFRRRWHTRARPRAMDTWY